MRDVVSTSTIISLLDSAADLREPARSEASLDKLEAWTMDPLLFLEQEQRDLINDALCRYGRR